MSVVLIGNDSPDGRVKKPYLAGYGLLFLY